MSSDLDLAALLCSRLCHDMLSPIGALSNGLELLAEEPDPAMRVRIVELLEQSARASADRLKFFRLAFGAASGFGEAVPTAEAQEAIEALTAGAGGSRGRIAVDWFLEDEALPKVAVKLLLNLGLIAIEALVRGGTLDIGAEVGAHALEIVVRAQGPRIAFDPEMGKALDGTLGVSALSSRTAPAVLACELAEQRGGGVQYASTGEMLVLGAVLPAG